MSANSMSKNIKGLFLAVLLCLPVQLSAGEMSFSKTVDAEKLADELKTDTDLDFRLTCSTCSVSGYIKTKGNSLVIVVYEISWASYILPVSFDTDLEDEITATVISHTP